MFLLSSELGGTLSEQVTGIVLMIYICASYKLELTKSIFRGIFKTRDIRKIGGSVLESEAKKISGSTIRRDGNGSWTHILAIFKSPDLW